ncbi:MAG: 4-hydroxythreonine-4-phosphate dehydrogenase PdxA [Bacteroidales bacterium]|nr:4-hydroxythreonine-4-phosphate dehydrogenase PdxA [Bacteroidales bacterium]MCF8333102.1 4-hydroxythreonine-4-phosphate dehydrogenase PdxA [Bacteroidales bacterium]
MDEQEGKEENIRVGITHGDVNSISYELIIKTFMDQRILDKITPIIFGSSKAASYHRKALNINNFNLNLVRSARQAVAHHANIVNIIDQEVKIELGKPTNSGGELAFMALEAAVDALKKGDIDVLVTAPINKNNIQSDKFTFPGHTEYLAERFGETDDLMLMIGNSMRIGVITGHIPLRQVHETITEDLILRKTRILHDSLIRDFGIEKPRVALLGLNPHAGDEGLIGREESETILPAIEKANQQNMLAFGPYPADGFFGTLNYKNFDGILAMYHDQGMLPFKTMAFNNGVNFTAGLPIIRTSPSHGTAYEIAGKGLASPESFREAIFLACDIHRNRQEYDNLKKNAFVSSKQNNAGQSEKN